MSIDNLVTIASCINNEKLEKFNSNKQRRKIGIMGGTFNPIHYAHLATAEYIRCKYHLDKIIFIPTGEPPHKLVRVISKQDRYNMALLSTLTNDDFIVSDIEIKRNKTTYTIDTLRYLKEEYPQIDIYFITGADTICEIDKWKDVEENLKLATFIATTRPGISVLTAQEKIQELEEKYEAKILSVYVPSLDISSTYIRNLVKENKSVRYLVPENVDEYISEKNLYEKNLYDINVEIKV